MSGKKHGETTALARMASYFRLLVSALPDVLRYREQVWLNADSLLRRCFIPVSLAVSPIAAVTALQGLEVLRLFGAEDRLSAFLGSTVLREYSPALAGVMIAAQAGSSIAARIGTMTLRGQLDALAMMGVAPMSYVVAPGLVACMIVSPVLSVWTDLIGIFAGWCFAVGRGGVNHGSFMQNLSLYVTSLDLGLGLVKCTFFGAIVGVVAGYHGMRVRGGAAAVGKAANDTVVHAIVAILISDYLIGMIVLKATS